MQEAKSVLLCLFNDCTLPLRICLNVLNLKCFFFLFIAIQGKKLSLFWDEKLYFLLYQKIPTFDFTFSFHSGNKHNGWLLSEGAVEPADFFFSLSFSGKICCQFYQYFMSCFCACWLMLIMPEQWFTNFSGARTT